MNIPKTEDAYRAWWYRTEVPLLRSQHAPELTASTLEDAWLRQRDTLIADGHLPRKALAWGRRQRDTRCECGHTRDDHGGRTGSGACWECGYCQRFKVDPCEPKVTRHAR